MFTILSLSPKHIFIWMITEFVFYTTTSQKTINLAVIF